MNRQSQWLFEVPTVSETTQFSNLHTNFEFYSNPEAEGNYRMAMLAALKGNRQLTTNPVINVCSLAIKLLSKKEILVQWQSLKRNLVRRDNLITNRLQAMATAIVNTKDPKQLKSINDQKLILLRLQSRWNLLRVMLNDPNVDPATATLPSTTKDIQDELKDIAKPIFANNKNNSSVIGESKGFVRKLKKILSDRNKLHDELLEFTRFDRIFSGDRDVTALLAASQVPFTPAEIKALICQETFDLTNISVAGINGKNKGIISNRANRICTSCVGIGQMKNDRMQQAIKWAKKNGVTIPTSPDPRIDPRTAIKLIAAALGDIIDELIRRLPGNKPSGNALKLFAFASYNSGPTSVVRAAGAFVRASPHNPQSYTWKNVCPSIRPEGKRYVARIENRLGQQSSCSKFTGISRQEVSCV